MTNRDIYLAIGNLVSGPARSSHRGLEEYLRALLRLCLSRKDGASLATEDFIETLTQAFIVEPLAYDPSWARSYPKKNDDLGDFPACEAILLKQIVDLHEMRQAGLLEGKSIYFGVTSPRGSRWYNFDPGGYLECAAAGAIGGWEPGDAGGRDFVPGPVTVLDAKGEFTSADPQDVERPVYAIDEVSWEMFTHFLVCGQMYE